MRPVDHIFPGRREAIAERTCVFYGDGNYHDMNLRTPLDEKEYQISGMCQTCQDSVFGG